MHVYNLYQLVHALDDHKYCTVAMVTSIGRSTSFMAVIRESLKLLSNTRNTKVVQQQPAILYDPLVRFNCRMSTTHSCIYTYYLSRPIQTYTGSRQISVLHATRDVAITLVDTTHYTQSCVYRFWLSLGSVSVTVSIAGLLVTPV